MNTEKQKQTHRYREQTSGHQRARGQERGRRLRGITCYVENKEALGIQLLFFNNFKWAIIQKNMEALFCTSETNIFSQIYFNLNFPGGQMAQNLPVMQKTWFQSLGREIPCRREWLSSNLKSKNLTLILLESVLFSIKIIHFFPLSPQNQAYFINDVSTINLWKQIINKMFNKFIR